MSRDVTTHPVPPDHGEPRRLGGPGSGRWRSAPTLVLAIVVGVLAPTVTEPWRRAGQDAAAVAAIARPSASAGGLAGRLSQWWDPAGAVARTIAASDPVAVDRIAAVLDARGAWSWDRRRSASMHHWLRTCEPAATAAEDGIRRFLAGLEEMPLDDTNAARATLGAAMARVPGSPDEASRIRQAVFGVVGRAPALTLSNPLFEPADRRGRRLRHLALEGDPYGLDEAIRLAIASSPPTPRSIVAAIVLRLATVEPDRIIDPAGDDDVAVLLDRLAADAPDVLTVARAAAGLRGPGIPAATPEPAAESLTTDRVDSMLDDDKVPVSSIALIAEAGLPAEDVARLTESCIRSFDDRRKRAGAVLAALGSPGSAAHLMLRHAHAIEDQGSVRVLQRLALIALGDRIGDGPPAALIRATITPADRAAVALLGGLAGDVDALRALTRLPEDAKVSTIAGAAIERDAALRRLVPHWTDAVGPIVAATPTGLRLHFDRLEARRLLETPILSFAPVRRAFAR